MHLFIIQKKKKIKENKKEKSNQEK